MLKKFVLGFGIVIISIYVLFLVLPLFLTGLINSYNDDISKLVEDSTGLKLKLEKLQLVTTPKLTAGIKAQNIKVKLPTDDSLFVADNAHVTMSLIPLIVKNIELDSIGADNIDLELKIKKDGKFLLEDYLKQNENNSDNSADSALTELPFGLKLSNRLPNISINKYNISFIDIPTNDKYAIFGEKFAISDFIINKKIKISADGKIKLKNSEQFEYNIKIFNRIMPDTNLQDLVFAQNSSEKAVQETQTVNVIDIFRSIYKNKITANLNADVKTSGTTEDMDILGKINISDISIAVDNKPLPLSYVDLDLKSKNFDIDSKFYTSDKETTTVQGHFISGKHPQIDLNFKSNAQFNSIINMIDSIAKTFNINDFDTLSATGGIDADFNIKSNMKKLESSGYIKIPNASILYKLYNASIDKIFADIQLANNIINIKDAGLTILNQPLKIKGTVSQEADIDLNITADKLQLKGLILAAGQIGLLKENKINSGTISLSVLAKGKPDKLEPKIDISIDNVDVKNIPSDTTVKAVNSKINVMTNGIKTNGNIDINDVKIINPLATVSVPSSNITLGEKDILINNSYLIFNNSRIDVKGKIADYMTKNINFDIKANGKIASKDVLTLIPQEYKSEVKTKGSMPLSVAITGNDKTQDVSFNLTSNFDNYASLLTIDELTGKNTVIKGDIKISGDSLKLSNTGISANNTAVAVLKGGINDLYKSQKLNMNFSTINNVSMVIPYFSKSKMNVGVNTDISGTSINPILKGTVNIPTLTMPEMLLSMNDLHINLNGPVARGKGTLKKIVSGGLAAENLSSDFELNNDMFYLKNMSGDAFKGKISGNISYNILNGKIGVDIKGSSMDAESAILGAAGIKNALSGTLGFDANVTTFGATDIDMMKNLKGSANFDIKNGKLGNIGRFETFVLAGNVVANPILKAAVETFSSLATVQKTAEFNSIDGKLNFDNGWADLSPVKMSGSTMSYYVTGKYNPVNASANVTVLGRISDEVVSVLGPLGSLSVNKLTSYIPVFGTATGNIINMLTSNPDKEKTDNIPALSSGNTNYKDFKVEFNGGIESTSSVKSFKWLSDCDTSEILKLNIKDEVEYAKNTINEIKQQHVDNFNKTVTEQKQQIQDTKKQINETVNETKNDLKNAVDEFKNTKDELKNTANELKNLFKLDNLIKTE